MIRLGWPDAAGQLYLHSHSTIYNAQETRLMKNVHPILELSTINGTSRNGVRVVFTDRCPNVNLALVGEFKKEKFIVKFREVPLTPLSSTLHWMGWAAFNTSIMTDDGTSCNFIVPSSRHLLADDEESPEGWTSHNNERFESRQSF